MLYENNLIENNSEHLIGIYKIINMIDNKVYIGQSTNIKNRYCSHKSDLKNNKHPNNHLQNAYNKYGKNNFKFEIIYICNEKDLDKKEIYWINFYNSTNRKYGYNLDSGGTIHKHHSEETKQKISKLNTGKKLTEEHKEKLSKAHKGKKISEETKKKLAETSRGNKNTLGRHHTEEAKQKISDKLRERKYTYGTKIICLNTLEVFNSITLASIKYNNINISNITNCCKGKRNSAGKDENNNSLKWMYYEDYIKIA